MSFDPLHGGGGMLISSVKRILSPQQGICGPVLGFLPWANGRGGLAVELGPGRFGSEGARNYSSEKFAGHSLGKFFVNTPPGLASNDTGLTSNNLNGSLYDELHSAIYLLK